MSLFVAGAAFGEVHVSLFVAGAAFGDVHVSLFVAGAAFGEVHVSLFVAGAAFGEVHVSLFVAGAAFGEVHVSLFVAGAAFGEVHVSFFVAGAALVKFMCHFSWQVQHVVKFGMIAGAGNVVIFNRVCSWRARKVASVARRVAVCVFWVGSWSDRSRVMLRSVAHWK